MAESTKTVRAEWRPGWYALDQSLEVGRRAQFAFLPPRAGGEDEPLIFYNTLWEPEDAVAAWGAITRITHPVLGAVVKVETEGLDYTFHLADGQRLIVDAEEQSGKRLIESGASWHRVAPRIGSWTLLVEIADLTALQPAPARLDGTP